MLCRPTRAGTRLPERSGGSRTCPAAPTAAATLEAGLDKPGGRCSSRSELTAGRSPVPRAGRSRSPSGAGFQREAAPGEPPQRDLGRLAGSWLPSGPRQRVAAVPTAGVTARRFLAGWRARPPRRGRWGGGVPRQMAAEPHEAATTRGIRLITDLQHGAHGHDRGSITASPLPPHRASKPRWRARRMR